MLAKFSFQDFKLLAYSNLKPSSVSKQPFQNNIPTDRSKEGIICTDRKQYGHVILTEMLGLDPENV
jgi:hypothetical protein